MSLRDYLSTQKWAILSLRRIAKSMKRPIATILRLIFPISRSSKLLEFKSGFSLIVPSWYHFQSIAETILLNAYHFPPLGTVTGCVIDVGASIGDFVISVRLSGHKGRIYAFEPDPISFGILQKNIELNDLHDVYSFNEAADGQSLLRILDIEKHIGFLKVDCEGCEYEFFKNVGESYLRNVAEIHMESHDFHHHRPPELEELFVSAGFNVKSEKLGGCPYLHATTRV